MGEMGRGRVYFLVELSMDEFKLSRVELSSVESDAYLAAARPGGNNGIACQRYGAGAHALSALFACQLLQLRMGALALV